MVASEVGDMGVNVAQVRFEGVSALVDISDDVSVVGFIDRAVLCYELAQAPIGEPDDLGIVFAENGFPEDIDVVRLRTKGGRRLVGEELFDEADDTHAPVGTRRANRPLSTNVNIGVFELVGAV